MNYYRIPLGARSVLLIFAVLVLAVGGSYRYLNTSAPAKEIRIGLLVSADTEPLLPRPADGRAVSTPNAPTLTSMTDAAELAAQEVNSEGGLEIAGHKHTLTLVIENDQDNPQIAVLAARKLINQKGVVALVGPPFSRNAIPVADIAEAAKIPMISPLSTNPETTAGKDYVFRTAFIDTFQGQVLAQFAARDLDMTKVAVLYDIANAYSKGMAEIFKQAFEAAGGQVVAFEHYTTDANQDFTQQLQRIQASGATGLFLPNFTADVITQVEQARAMSIDATLLGSDGWVSPWLVDNPLFEGTYFTAHWDPDSTNQQSQAFCQSYRRAYRREPLAIAALTYDAMQLLFMAIRQQGQSDPQAIRDGLASIESYDGVTGTMEYRGTGDPSKPVIIMSIRGGKSFAYKQIPPAQ